MRKQLKLFFLLSVIIMGTFAALSRLFFLAASATYVEGNIDQDTVWTLVDSPFVVINDVVVKPYGTLTIEPGVEVRFGGNFSLIVEGTLTAIGTQENKITFTSNKHEPEGGDWNAIRFMNRTQLSTMMYCIVKYATNGLTIQNGYVRIENSEISENEVGISITGDNQVTLQNNILRANGDGVFLTGNSASGINMRQNLVLLSTKSGIELNADNYTNTVIWNNTISSNNYGFLVSGGTETRITNNSISYNSIGIFYEGGKDHEAHFNDIYGNNFGMDLLADALVNAAYNYWGDESGPHHVSLNPNGKGNPVGGDGINIDFIFFLTSPIGYINQRPTANLLSNMKTVRPDQDVTFFATLSSDDKRVDLYYFDFGDGHSTNWTTLSVFNHRYSSVGTYYARVTVMDDFGVKSTNAATLRIDVQNLPSMTVSLTPDDLTVGSDRAVPIMVYATDGVSPAANANITLLSIVGGSFTPSSGLTNSTGYFTALFTAPNIIEKTYVRITATASKNGYTDGSDYEYLSVLPILALNFAADLNFVKSEATLDGTVHVTHNENPLVGVVIKLLSDNGGSLSPANGSTDANGDFKFTFQAPQTMTQLNVTVTATATKSGYWDGEAKITITVDPKILTVQVTSDPATVESQATSNALVHVTSDGVPVANANVSLSSDMGGTLSVTTGTTDASGDFRATFTAPKITEQTNFTITASVTKTGYINGEGQGKILVTSIPVSGPGDFFGLPLTTLLLIIIPIVAVAVVAVLIKAKIIIISRE